MKSNWILAGAVFASSLAYGNLISNAGFEAPVVTPGAFAQYGTGSVGITDWLVTGACGANCVLQIDDSYAEGSLVFNPNSGQQHLDLTGAVNTVVGGVSQTVALTVGTPYTLSFYLGNADNTVSTYLLFSSLEVFINGATQGVFTSTATTVNAISWELFSFNFTPTVASNTILFQNRTTGDNFTGLDDVSLVAAVPEPGSFALLGLGLLGLGFMRRRRAS